MKTPGRELTVPVFRLGQTWKPNIAASPLVAPATTENSTTRVHEVVLGAKQDRSDRKFGLL